MVQGVKVKSGHFGSKFILNQNTICDQIPFWITKLDLKVSMSKWPWCCTNDVMCLIKFFFNFFFPHHFPVANGQMVGLYQCQN